GRMKMLWQANSTRSDVARSDGTRPDGTQSDAARADATPSRATQPLPAQADVPPREPGGAGWKQRPEGGGRFAIWLIRSIALRLGRAPARLLLYPITLYFLLVRGPERRASRAYLARVLGRPV